MKFSLQNFKFKQRDEIEKYESELIAKDNLLEQCHRKIEEMDVKLKQLEAENRLLLTQKSQEELERIQLKKQSFTLNLKNTTTTSSIDVQTDAAGTIDGAKTAGTETTTSDTFHTANSDCSFASALPSPFPPKTSQQLLQQNQTPASEISSLPDDGKALMSDSGVCLDAKHHEHHPLASSATTTVHPLAKHSFDGDNLSTNSSQNFYEQLLQSQMGKLREEIASKKAKIMKILELGGEKSTLDMMINELQELQKDYVKMEMRLENSRGENLTDIKNHSMMINIFLFFSDSCVSDGETSTELREITGSSTDSEGSRHNPLTMSTMSTRHNSLTASLFVHHIMTRSLPTIEGSFQSQTTIRE